MFLFQGSQIFWPGSSIGDHASSIQRAFLKAPQVVASNSIYLLNLIVYALKRDQSTENLQTLKGI